MILVTSMGQCRECPRLSRGIIAQSLSMKTNTDTFASFTQDLTCVTYPLLSGTMHLLQVQRGRSGRRAVFKISANGSEGPAFTTKPSRSRKVSRFS